MIKTNLILNNHYKTINTNKYLFHISYFGLNLYCRLSKNQKRKLIKYGITPNKPNKDNLILTNQRIKIKKYTSYKYHKQTKEKRKRTYLTINKNLLRTNNLSFMPKDSNSILSQEIGLLFKTTLLNHISISERQPNLKQTDTERGE